MHPTLHDAAYHAASIGHVQVPRSQEAPLRGIGLNGRWFKRTVWRSEAVTPARLLAMQARRLTDLFRGEGSYRPRTGCGGDRMFSQGVGDEPAVRRRAGGGTNSGRRRSSGKGDWPDIPGGGREGDGVAPSGPGDDKPIPTLSPKDRASSEHCTAAGERGALPLKGREPQVEQCRYFQQGGLTEPHCV